MSRQQSKGKAMKDIDSELKRIQGIAIEHAIEEVDASHQRTLETKEERGDRGWLSQMASRSLAVAVKIETLLNMRRNGGTKDDEEREREAKQQLLDQAQAEVSRILRKVTEHDG
jgi:hypothetical protein